MTVKSRPRMVCHLHQTNWQHHVTATCFKFMCKEVHVNNATNDYVLPYAILFGTQVTSRNSEHIILKVVARSRWICNYESIETKLENCTIWLWTQTVSRRPQTEADTAGHNTKSNAIVTVSRHARTGQSWRSHLNQDPIKPLQWTIEMNLYPTWCARYRLPPNNNQNNIIHTSALVETPTTLHNNINGHIIIIINVTWTPIYFGVSLTCCFCIFNQ